MLLDFGDMASTLDVNEHGPSEGPLTGMAQAEPLVSTRPIRRDKDAQLGGRTEVDRRNRRCRRTNWHKQVTSRLR